MCVAAAQGIGAGVIHTEPGALVQELLPGKALTAAEVKAALAPDGDAPLLKALASTLRKLHGAPMPPEIPMPGIADRKVGAARSAALAHAREGRRLHAHPDRRRRRGAPRRGRRLPRHAALRRLLPL